VGKTMVLDVLCSRFLSSSQNEHDIDIVKCILDDPFVLKENIYDV